MIQIELTPDEQQILSQILDEDLSELRMEIANTDSQDYRARLRERKEVLMRVLETIHPAGSA